MITITIPDANDSVVAVVLEQRKYFMHFAWNDTAGFWSIGIWDDKKQPIIERVKCVPNYPLLLQYSKASLPKGELLCITDAEKIGRNDFVTGAAKLVYVLEGELHGTV